MTDMFGDTSAGELPTSHKRLRAMLNSCQNGKAALNIAKTFRGSSRADALVAVSSVPGFPEALLEDPCRLRFVQELVDAFNDSDEVAFQNVLVRLGEVPEGLQSLLQCKRLPQSILVAVVELLLTRAAIFGETPSEPELECLVDRLEPSCVSLLLLRSVEKQKGLVGAGALWVATALMKHDGKRALSLWMEELRGVLETVKDEEREGSSRLMDACAAIRTIQLGLRTEGDAENKYVNLLNEGLAPLLTQPHIARAWLDIATGLIETDPSWALRVHKKLALSLKQCAPRAKYLTLVREQLKDPTTEDKESARIVADNLLLEVAKTGSLGDATMTSLKARPIFFSHYVQPLLEGRMNGRALVHIVKNVAKAETEAVQQGYGHETDETLADVCNLAVQLVTQELSQMEVVDLSNNKETDVEEVVARLRIYLKTFAALAESPDASLVECGVRTVLFRTIRGGSDRLEQLQAVFLQIDPHIRTPIVESLAWEALTNASIIHGEPVLGILHRSALCAAVLSQFFSHLARLAAGSNIDLALKAVGLFSRVSRKYTTVCSPAMRWLRERIPTLELHLVHPALDEFDGFDLTETSRFPDVHEFFTLELATGSFFRSLSGVQFCLDAMLTRFPRETAVPGAITVLLSSPKTLDLPVHITMALHLAMQRSFSFPAAMATFRNTWYGCVSSAESPEGILTISIKAWTLARILFPDTSQLFAGEIDGKAKLGLDSIGHPFPDELLAVMPASFLDYAH